MVKLSEADLLAFRRRQDIAKMQEKANAVASAAEDEEDSSATNSGLIRKRPRRDEPASPPLTLPTTTIIISPPRLNTITPPPAAGTSSFAPSHSAPPTQRLTSELEENFKSLWSSEFPYNETIQQHLSTIGDAEKMAEVDAENSCQLISVEALRIAFLAHSLEKKIGSSSKESKKAKKDLETANRRVKRYADQAETLKTQLGQVKEEKEKETKSFQGKLSDLEKELENLKKEKTELTTTLASKDEEITGLNRKVASMEQTVSKLEGEVLDLTGDCLGQFEAGFAKAIKQVAFIAPELDTSTMGPFKVIQDGDLIDPPE